jgi:hypothetical protein
VSWCGATARAESHILGNADLTRFVNEFNDLSGTPADSAIPNESAAQWMVANVPLFDCPDADLEKTYYFRWWTYRKHIRNTPHGRVITEFITPVSHAGPYNTISCAFGHHLAEGRWLRDQGPLDEYTHFWFRSGVGPPSRGGQDSAATAAARLAAATGKPAEHFHKYSSWAAAALYNRYLVTGDREFLIDLLDDLVADYKQWEVERKYPGDASLFWQFDVRDGMEESISGDRHKKHVRPTINSYMAANARAIAQVARLARRPELETTFKEKAANIREELTDQLWDPNAKFFKVKFEAPPVAESLRDSDEKSSAQLSTSVPLSDAREAIGFIPWTFNLAELNHSEAWKQLRDPQGFWAPRGLTTAEQRHPKFRTHGTGTCEWDGAVWPFATSQTLTGLANYLRSKLHPFVTKRDFFDAMKIYAASHTLDGKPYIGEYHDHETGAWLITGPKAERSRDYNHSTFCDLVITGLVGLVPREDNTVEVHPLIPKDTWSYFCLDNIPYHGQTLTIIWDESGSHYHRGQGFTIYANSKKIAHASQLTHLFGTLAER